jgi:putative transposase
LGMEDLNARLDAWIQTAYHRSLHGGLDTTPLLRWQRDIERVRQLPPATDVRRLFFYRLDRVVRRDSTFLLQKRFYEAPAHLATHKVEVRFDPMDPSQADIYSGGIFQGAARLVDPVANGLWLAAKPEPPAPPQPTGINYVELLHQRREDSDV